MSQTTDTDFIPIKHLGREPECKRNGRDGGIHAAYRLYRIGKLSKRGKRVKLQCVMLPAGLHTTRAFIEEFIAALNDDPVEAAIADAYAAGEKRRAPVRSNGATPSRSASYLQACGI